MWPLGQIPALTEPCSLYWLRYITLTNSCKYDQRLKIKLILLKSQSVCYKMKIKHFIWNGDDAAVFVSLPTVLHELQKAVSFGQVAVNQTFSIKVSPMPRCQDFDQWIELGFIISELYPNSVFFSILTIFGVTQTFKIVQFKSQVQKSNISLTPAVQHILFSIQHISIIHTCEVFLNMQITENNVVYLLKTIQIMSILI